MVTHTDRYLWGPHVWYVLHDLSFRFDGSTERERRDMLTFLRAIGRVLPCATCRRHYQNTPLTSKDVRDRDSLVRWVASLHNDVNRRLGRETWTMQRLRDQWSSRIGTSSGDVSCACNIDIEDARASDEGKRTVGITCGVVVACLVLIVAIVVAVVYAKRRGGRV